MRAAWAILAVSSRPPACLTSGMSTSTMRRVRKGRKPSMPNTFSAEAVVTRQALPQVALIQGVAGIGKTRLAEILITQDIRRGDVVIVFDPKGDADLLRRVYAEAKRAGRGRDFYLFHLG